MLGMLALGLKKDLNEMRAFFSVKETFEPDLNDHDVYIEKL